MKRPTQQRLAQMAVAIALAAGAISAAQAQSYLDVDFDSPNTFGNETPAFRGSFTYDGVVYGPSSAVANPATGVAAPSANSINLSQFAADTLYNGSTATKLGNDGTYLYPDAEQTRGANVVYRIYRQQYAGVVGNLTKGVNNEQEERRHFVKAVVGQGTDFDDLPSSGTYQYEGVAFSNFPEGNFSYTVDLASKTGSGSFDLNGLLVPGAWAAEYYPGEYVAGTNYDLNVAGTLDTASLVADANGIVGSAGVEGGTVTAGAAPGSDAQLWTTIVQKSTDAVDPKYYLNFFGTSSGANVAKEVAGTIIGLPERIGGVAIIGKR